MSNDLISRSYLKNLPFERQIHTDFGETAIPIEELDNAPSVNPCDNCDLYFKATTKEIDRWYKKEEQKGGTE